jgi:Zn-dependent protease
LDWQGIAYTLIGLLIGVVLHEYMHGRTADRLGDHTARTAGRLTLNPVPHIDPIGTVLLPIGLALLSRGQFTFGYAKPVPVNPFFFKKPRRGMVEVALAGPLTNFAVAIVVVGVGVGLRLLLNLQFVINQSGNLVVVNKASWWVDLAFLLFYVAVINIFLGVFNLIPIPPLDGSHVLEYFLSPSAQEAYERFARYGFILVFVLVFFAGGAIFGPIQNVVSKLIFGTVRQIINVF